MTSAITWYNSQDQAQSQSDQSTQTQTQCKDKNKDDDICYQLYLAETADCGSRYTDDKEYDACMEVAEINYQRCKDKMEPIRLK
jgi:hypothetical protein